MKRIILVIAGLLAAVAASAQGISFFHGSYEQALEQAQKENKGIFVDVYTSWCGPCKMMAKKVFTDPKVGRYFNSRFVCLKLDAEKEKEHGFFKNYRANGFPSVFWLNAKGQLLDVHTGFVEAEGFLKLAEAAESSDFAKRLEAGSKRWEAGERTAALVDEYVLGLLGRVKPEAVGPMVMEYLSARTGKELLEQENYRFLRMFMREAKDDFVFNTLLRNAEVYQKYDKNYGFWIQMYRMVVRSGIAGRNDKAKYNAYLEMLEKKDTPLTDMYVKILDMEYKLFQKKFKRGIADADKILDEYGGQHPYLCSQFLYTLIISGFFEEEEVDDRLADTVIGWAVKALKTVPCKENLMYLSVAHTRKGDYRKAWQLLGGMPFFPEPMLSNAVYRYIGLPVFHRQYLK